jgi:hypothetical protein
MGERRSSWRSGSTFHLRAVDETGGGRVELLHDPFWPL